MDYDFYKFSTTEFEHMVQALTQKLLGNNAITYGAGPDGGRELTFEGTASYPNETTPWSGYWVVQAKFKSRNFFSDNDYAWVASNFSSEMEKFKGNNKVPDNYLFITNAVLTPVKDKGGRDRIEELKKEYQSIIPNIAIIGYDDLCRLLDNNRDVASAYRQLLLPGDVLNAILEKLNLNKADITLQDREIRENKVNTEPNLNIDDNPILCVDFGTSNSLCAILTKDNVYHLIPSDKNQKIIPSVVTFFEDEFYVVGRPEYAMINSKKTTTITNVKRDIGTRKKYQVGNQSFSPEEVASLIIKSLKRNAEEFLGMEITSVVTARPANFNIVQTNALIKAFSLAGLTVKRIIDEGSIAGFIANGNTTYPRAIPSAKIPSDCNLLTIDIGGGTSDFSLISYGDGVYEILNVVGDNNLGGIDFDRAIYNYAYNEIRKLGIDSSGLSQQLLYESERVKKALTRDETASIVLKDIEDKNGNLQDYMIEISREKFGILTLDLQKKITECIHLVLKDTPYPEMILLTGQGAKILPVEKTIQGAFPNTPIVKDFMENAVVLGELMLTGILTGYDKSDFLMVNATSSSMYVNCKEVVHHRNKDGVITATDITISLRSEENTLMEAILKKGRSIPALESFNLLIDNPDDKWTFPLEIFEASNDRDKYRLAKLSLPASFGKNTFKLTIEVDADFTIILTISNQTHRSSYQLNNHHNHRSGSLVEYSNVD